MPYDQRQIDAMAAAYLAHHYPNMRQAEIAALLKGARREDKERTQSDVSKLLKTARDHHWYSSVLNLPLKDLTSSQLDQIQIGRYANLEKLSDMIGQLHKRRGSRRRTRVHVIYGGRNEAERLTVFGRAAALRVLDILEKSQFAGIAWGRTIMALVEGVEAAEPRKFERLCLIPTSGEPLGHPLIDHSASTAALRLKQCLGCKALSLRGVPLRIPLSMARDERTIRRFVNRSDDYRQVFGDRADGLIEQIDTMISGIGDSASSIGDRWLEETEKAEELRPGDLDKVAAGNVGGVWFARDESNPDHVKQVKGINHRWLGIKYEHFKRCADTADAAPNERGGVVILAAGAAKARILASHAIAMCNTLIIDDVCADALLQQLNDDGSSQVKAPRGRISVDRRKA
jgi:DNA-binding transcriptional regulator LsrR (DeoR family)